MKQRKLKVDERYSFAHRRGTSVRVALQVQAPELSGQTAGPAEVRLRSAQRRLSVPAETSPTPGALTLTFEVPQRRLGAEVWRLAVRSPDSQAMLGLEARLLSRPGQPVALLVGPEPDTRLPALVPSPPQPRAARLVGSLPQPVRGVLRKGRAALRSGTAR
jgi:hypothetical protein